MNPQLLQKLQITVENPGFYRHLSPEEQAEIFLYLIASKLKKPKLIAGQDGYTPVADKDYLSKKSAEKQITDFFAKKEKEINKVISNRLSKVKDGEDGKDAEVTPELIESIIAEAVSRISLPEYNEFDDSEIRELISNNELDHEELRDEVEKLKEQFKEQLPQTIVGGGAQTNWVKKYVKEQLGGISVTGVAESFETVSKNLSSYPATLSYTGNNLTSIVYTTGGGTITKTLNYTGNDLTSVVLSGDTPGGIDLIKTLSYSGANLTGVSYS